MSRVPWDFRDLDGYIREGKPDQATRAENWQTAIGLQAVDGLTTSSYLFETAREHIEGQMSAMELMNSLGISHRHTFRQNYLNPTLEAGLIERAIPDKPTSRLQKYRKAGRRAQIQPRA